MAKSRYPNHSKLVSLAGPQPKSGPSNSTSHESRKLGPRNASKEAVAGVVNFVDSFLKH